MNDTKNNTGVQWEGENGLENILFNQGKKIARLGKIYKACQSVKEMSKPDTKTEHYDKAIKYLELMEVDYDIEEFNLAFSMANGCCIDFDVPDKFIESYIDADSLQEIRGRSVEINEVAEKILNDENAPEPVKKIVRAIHGLKKDLNGDNDSKEADSKIDPEESQDQET